MVELAAPSTAPWPGPSAARSELPGRGRLERARAASSAPVAGERGPATGRAAPGTRVALDPQVKVKPAAPTPSAWPDPSAARSELPGRGRLKRSRAAARTPGVGGRGPAVGGVEAPSRGRRWHWWTPSGAPASRAAAKRAEPAPLVVWGPSGRAVAAAPVVTSEPAPPVAKGYPRRGRLGGASGAPLVGQGSPRGRRAPERASPGLGAPGRTRDDGPAGDGLHAREVGSGARDPAGTCAAVVPASGTCVWATFPRCRNAGAHGGPKDRRQVPPIRGSRPPRARLRRIARASRTTAGGAALAAVRRRRASEA